MKTIQGKTSALLIIIIALSAWTSAWAEEKVLTIYFAGTSFTTNKTFPGPNQTIHSELISELYFDDDSREIAVNFTSHEAIIPSGTGTKYKAFLKGMTGFDTDPFHGGRTFYVCLQEATNVFNKVAAESGEHTIVNLVGFSRGGVSAMLMAFALRNETPPVKINVLAIDPVPGATAGNPIEWLGRANLNLEHVNQFVGIYAEDERTHRFEPILPGVSSDPNKSLLLSLPGAHETLVGSMDTSGHPGDGAGGYDLDLRCDYKICREVAEQLLSGPEWGHIGIDEEVTQQDFFDAVHDMNIYDDFHGMRLWPLIIPTGWYWSGYENGQHSGYARRGFERLAFWLQVFWVKPSASINNPRLMYRWPYDFSGNDDGSWDIVFYLNETNFKSYTSTNPNDNWEIIPSEMPIIKSLTGNEDEVWDKVELLRGYPIPNVAELPFVTGETPITLSVPTATDYTDGVVTHGLEGVPDIGPTISVPGSYMVAWTYTDVDGNETTQTQQVDASSTPEIYAQADDTVFGEVETYSVRANHNYQVVGILSWTNETTGASGSVPASDSTYEIEASDIYLGWGPNVITFAGTNAFGGATSDSTIITRSFEHGGDSSTHYVSLGGSDTWPYTNWTTAANSIQTAIDAAVGSDMVHVADGTYNTDGAADPHSMSNRVVLAKAVTVQSENGPEHTFIDGLDAMRCAYFTDGTLIGFTLVNGSTGGAGGGGALCDGGGTLENCIIEGNEATGIAGGVYCNHGGTLENCTIANNTAGSAGGGTYCYAGGTLNHCTIVGNTAQTAGGGVRCWKIGSMFNNCIIASNSATAGGGVALSDHQSTGSGTFNNCTISDNTATNEGGGVYSGNSGTLNNCIVWGNSASFNENWQGSGGWFNCCTTPPNGVDCITDNPMFVEPGADYRLQLGSPCIDASDAFGREDDIEGTPRPLDGDNDGTALPDIGAYEFISPVADTDGDGLADGAEMGTLGTSPLSSNTDGDGFNDYEEYVADTDGADSNDFFRIVECNGKTVWFQSSAERQYTLKWSWDLEYWSIVREQADIPGNGSLDSLTDPYDDPACFYRVEVEIP